ncbi:MAG: D-2-hydroxyacid dehydrogenase [Vagococcus sp.]
MRVLMMGSRKDEVPFAKKWAEKNQVDIEITSDILCEETFNQLKGFDGLSLQQTMGIPADMYKRLKEAGINQIAQRSTGFDMYDLEAAKDAGIIITNVPAYSPNAIAEFAVSSALNCIRHHNQIAQRMALQNFSWDASILSKELRSLTVGIIGTGRIGQVTAELFKGFGATIIGYDPYPSKQAESLLTYVDSVEDLVQQADLISIHSPATKENHHLFNDALFNQMKDGSFLVNAARGAIVDTQALLRALESGKLTACALDTYENEMPYVTKDWSNKDLNDPVLTQLLERDDVYYSPHIAFYTETAVANLVEGGLNACLDVLKTGTSANKVN